MFPQLISGVQRASASALLRPARDSDRRHRGSRVARQVSRTHSAGRWAGPGFAREQEVSWAGPHGTGWRPGGCHWVIVWQATGVTKCDFCVSPRARNCVCNCVITICNYVLMWLCLCMTLWVWLSENSCVCVTQRVILSYRKIKITCLGSHS